MLFYHSSGVGVPSGFVLLSLVIKEAVLTQLIGQNLDRQGDRTEFWEEEGSVADAMIFLPKKDIGQTHACKPQSSGDTH